MAENPSQTTSDVPEVDLRNARLAAFLAWLVPGLGHLYQRRTGKGLLFMITILGTFAYGMYLGGGRVVYASSTRPPIPMGISRQAIARAFENAGRWHYFCQLPVGVVALPAYVQAWRVESGKAPLDLFGDNFERPPYTPLDAERLFPNKSKTERDAEYFQTKDFNEEIVYHATEQQKWNHDLNYNFELGTVFTMVAGLLNVLAICDARWGPLVALPPPGEKPDNPGTDKQESSE
ncbi:hypothetical protein NG895_19505 [Aeoliella sp. ICT_H6.2]|uniref:DUF6677 domain-containing protein n=1 Tax=Aeoliella straminimaris TaxID=2954799 RepID=A0A9X2JI28_9BACT|nr:DUF6677 family protein [Aeoliella straminimaris]MCO6046092.1 hypothetical protein [Aeoliella straminimaris]